MGSSCQEPDDPLVSKDEYGKCMKDRNDNEMPGHRVTIRRTFAIGQYEVTQAQWYAVMGTNPSEFKSDKVGVDSGNFPVENVSWYDVQVQEVQGDAHFIIRFSLRIE